MYRPGGCYTASQLQQSTLVWELREEEEARSGREGRGRAVMGILSISEGPRGQMEGGVWVTHEHMQRFQPTRTRRTCSVQKVPGDGICVKVVSAFREGFFESRWVLSDVMRGLMHRNP